MCVHYRLLLKNNELIEQFYMMKHLPLPEHVYPNQKAPILTINSGGLEVSEMIWGIPVDWSKNTIVNARSESVYNKPLFKEAMSYHRCIIPVSGFYEWAMLDNKKQEIYFNSHSQETLYIAGCYYNYNNQLYFVMLTKNANDSVKNFHHRMPVVLSKEAFPIYLSNEHSVATLLKEANQDLRHHISI